MKCKFYTNCKGIGLIRSTESVRFAGPHYTWCSMPCWSVWALQEFNDAAFLDPDWPIRLNILLWKAKLHPCSYCSNLDVRKTSPTEWNQEQKKLRKRQLLLWFKDNTIQVFLIQYTTPLDSFTCRSFCVHFHSMPHLLLLIGLTTGRYINPLKWMNSWTVFNAIQLYLIQCKEKPSFQSSKVWNCNCGWKTCFSNENSTFQSRSVEDCFWWLVSWGRWRMNLSQAWLWIIKFTWDWWEEWNIFEWISFRVTTYHQSIFLLFKYQSVISNGKASVALSVGTHHLF